MALFTLLTEAQWDGLPRVVQAAMDRAQGMVRQTTHSCPEPPEPFIKASWSQVLPTTCPPVLRGAQTL